MVIVVLVAAAPVVVDDVVAVVAGASAVSETASLRVDFANPASSLLGLFVCRSAPSLRLTPLSPWSSPE